MTASPSDGSHASSPAGARPAPAPPPFEYGQVPPGSYDPPAYPTYGAAPAGPASPAAAPSSSDDDRTWGMLAHLGALLASLASASFLGLAVPLGILLTKGQRSAYVRRHAVESLNFQLTVLLVAVVGGFLAILATILTVGIGLLVIVPAALAYFAFVLVMPVVATIRANSGQDYRYPLSIRFVR